ncbi:MAG: 30S ribosomal protein S17 [Thermoplasmata archaeon]
MTKKSIGYETKQPETVCKDDKCPYHGTLPVRGIVISGKVISAKMQSTVVVEREILKYVKKYERYSKIKKTYMAHSPPCIAPKEGDYVTIAECRPISKGVSFVVIEKR